MAKKDKAAKAAPGTAEKVVKTGKLPKRVAGIKVPKELRKSGAKLLYAANSPIGRQVLAAGFTALVAAAASRSKTVQAVGRDAADAVGTTADTAKVAADAGMTQASEIVDAIANAAGAALQKMFDKKG